MTSRTENWLVDTAPFFQSLRDSGYKSPSTAIAELIDNSIDAQATTIDVHLRHCAKQPDRSEIVVVDNGFGMSPKEARKSLQLGAGDKRRDRSRLGRFGIGLVNAAFSLARKIEVYSWKNPSYVWMTYLDLDQILNKEQCTVPRSVRKPWPSDLSKGSYPTGTMIRLHNVDRLAHRYATPVCKRLRVDFGRIFRRYLRSDLVIRVAGVPVSAIDPLFLEKEPGSPIQARRYGEPLALEIRDLGISTLALGQVHRVVIEFSELPVIDGATLSTDDKRRIGILKGAGVSVLRRDREIDYGWFFMGSKRKENYDDWWRCQISFSPDLDELFGVTNTKQGIRPSERLMQILTPHVEATARALNRRTRSSFAHLKNHKSKARSSRIATANDRFVPVVTNLSASNSKKQGSIPYPLRHEIQYQDMTDGCLFTSSAVGRTVCTRINTLHPFGHRLHKLAEAGPATDLSAVELMELLLHAAARAEIRLDKSQSARFREQWAKVLNAYLS